jgi:hypothetical protein
MRWKELLYQNLQEVKGAAREKSEDHGWVYCEISILVPSIYSVISTSLSFKQVHDVQRLRKVIRVLLRQGITAFNIVSIIFVQLPDKSTELSIATPQLTDTLPFVTHHYWGFSRLSTSR